MGVLDNEESTLSFTQRERLRVVNALGAENLIGDPKCATVLLKALDGMDKQVLTQKKLNIEQQSADSDKEIALLLAQSSERRSREMSNPFRRSDVSTKIPDTTEVVLGDFSFTEAELSDEVTKTTAQKFMNEYRERNGLNRND